MYVDLIQRSIPAGRCRVPNMSKLTSEIGCCVIWAGPLVDRGFLPGRQGREGNPVH